MAPTAEAMPRKARHATAPSCLCRPACAALIETPLAADPITSTDHEDREVTLPSPAQRIASIPIPMASTLIAIDGATDRLVGMSAADVTWHLHGHFDPPAGAEVLVRDDEGRGIAYVDRSTVPGRIIVTLLNPCYHDGSQFMPATTRFLDRFLPNLRHMTEQVPA